MCQCIVLQLTRLIAIQRELQLVQHFGQSVHRGCNCKRTEQLQRRGLPAGEFRRYRDQYVEPETRYDVNAHKLTNF